MKKLLIGLIALITVSASASELTFRCDDRLADGTLKELNIKSLNVRNGSQVKLRTVRMNHMIGENAEKVDLDLSGMDCFQAGEGAQLNFINCSRDDRPLDSAKVEVIVKKNKRNTFDVIKTTTVVSRMTSEQSTKT